MELAKHSKTWNKETRRGISWYAIRNVRYFKRNMLTQKGAMRTGKGVVRAGRRYNNMDHMDKNF